MGRIFMSEQSAGSGDTGAKEFGPEGNLDAFCGPAEMELQEMQGAGYH